MREANAPLIRRLDYAPPPFWIRKVELTFDLDPAKTIVASRLAIERNAAVPPGQPLALHGEGLNLMRVQADGQSVSFRHEDNLLVIDNPPAADSFTLEIRNTCCPEKNTQLSGLYTSGGGFFTQCEAEGFRRITYFLDRPDVMAVYTSRCAPTRPGTRCCSPTATWWSRASSTAAVTSPGGTTRSPSPAICSRWSRPTWCAREHRVTHARRQGPPAADLRAPRQARPGRLAMHSLNARGVGRGALRARARPRALHDRRRRRLQRRRDGEQGPEHLQHQVRAGPPGDRDRRDYFDIDSVVGHEYFHNWTGNRVTCRDWFQLSLKEGLTVFRDQEYAHGHGRHASARAVKRIQEVRELRTGSSPRTPARWRTRCGPTSTSRSTTSTPPPSTRRAPRWCA